MHMRIDYLADKNCSTELNRSPRLRRQWQGILEECRQTEAELEEWLHITPLDVDYVTSSGLSPCLLLARTPQLVATLREEWGISQKNMVFNDKRSGRVYNLEASLLDGPGTLQYHLSHRIRWVVANEDTSLPYRLVTQEVEAPRQRLEYTLGAGLQVSVLDGLFWFGGQHVTADILRLRKYGMRVATASVDVYNNMTGTARHIPVYYS